MHELKLIPQTNVTEMLLNWCFYSGFLMVCMKLADLGEFSYMPWWKVMIPWLLPFIVLAFTVVLALLITIGQRLLGGQKIEIDVSPTDNE